MPISKLHETKKVKNWTLLAVLLAMVAFFFVLGILRFQGA